MADATATRIVLEISGGVLQNVFCTDPTMAIAAVDWDADGCAPSDDGIVEIPCDRGGTKLAMATEYPVSPLSDLAGTMTEAAMKAAGFDWVAQPGPATGVVPHRETADDAHDRLGIDNRVDDDACCECELPGCFCSGVASILAHMENGRLAQGAVVERCDLCQRYPSDEAALEKLRELGYGPP